jgi:hypothetical protein
VVPNDRTLARPNHQHLGRAAGSAVAEVRRVIEVDQDPIVEEVGLAEVADAASFQAEAGVCEGARREPMPAGDHGDSAFPRFHCSRHERTFGRWL